jgi:Fe-S cluster assembly protein SufD
MIAALVPPLRGATDYAAAYARLDGTTPAWLTERRRHAFERFQNVGFPTTREEAWKYTDVAPIARTSFQPGAATGLALPDLERLLVPGLDGPRLVFVNGHYDARLSRTSGPPGVRVGRLTESWDAAENRLGRVASIEENPFVALNTGLLHDGAHVRIDANVQAPPVQVVHVTAPASGPTAAHPRTLVEIGPHAHLDLIQIFAGASGPATFTNAVTEAVVEENGHLEHATLQRHPDSAFHTATVEARLGRAARFTDHNHAFGGALARTDLNVTFDGEGGEASLNGLYLLRGTQHVDNHSRVDHARPHCTSNEFYKGILDDKSRGVFYGKVLIRKDAQKTNAGQTNKNLLLSDGALVDSTPALEINADDVKAAHGSTIGQIDRNQAFYLQARGLDAATARSLLTYAFAREVITRVRLQPLQAHLEDLLLSRLPHGAIVREVLHESQV